MRLRLCLPAVCEDWDLKGSGLRGCARTSRLTRLPHLHGGLWPGNRRRIGMSRCPDPRYILQYPFDVLENAGAESIQAESMMPAVATEQAWLKVVYRDKGYDLWTA